MKEITYSVHYKEKLYYFICLAISMMTYASLIGHLKPFPEMMEHLASRVDNIPMFVFIVFFVLLMLVKKIIFMGYLRGNGIEITATQFPDIAAIVQQQASALKLSRIPRLYLLHDQSLLNAFAARFGCKQYVVLYNSVLEAAYEESSEAVEFIIGHELGHIKRGHTSFFKDLFILPALFVPFLRSAYSRACEYTCDSIGYALSPLGAQSGVLILAAGKRLYKQVNTEQWLAQFAQQRGFCTWFSEIYATHPHTVKRIQAIRQHIARAKEQTA